MPEIKVKLELPKATSDLTGNKLGRSIFEKQLLQYFTNENVNVIVEIPEDINDVGTSFIQGIYAFLCEKYGDVQALDIMRIYSNKKETNEKIKEVIEVYGI